jgi:TPR repeat protein
VLLHILAQLLFDTKTQLAVKYTFGKGVLKDYKQAVYWYQKAADQGDAKAQSNLGTMYAFIFLLSCFLIPRCSLLSVF